MLTDTHAHLDFPDFDDQIDEVLAHAESLGVKRIITIGTTIEGSRRAVALAEKYAQVFAAIGVHPNSAGDAPEDFQAQLRELARNPRVVAIGETGLDYHRLPSSRMHEAAVATQALGNETPADVSASLADGAVKQKQAAVFEQQLDLAAELGLNVVIHQRDAWDDTLAILARWEPRVCGVFHCFTEPAERVAEVCARGHYVSFTGILTFGNAELVRESAVAAPEDRFMVETDCPFLAPIPFRGKRAEPAHVRFTAEKIAQLRDTTLEALAAQTESNANTFFRFTRP